MKRNAVPARKQPIAWGDVEYAALRDNGADGIDGLIGGMDFDSENQRVAVELLLRKMINGVG